MDTGSYFSKEAWRGVEDFVLTSVAISFVYFFKFQVFSGVLEPFGVDQEKLLQVLSEKAPRSVYQALIKACCQTQQSTNIRGVWRRTINMCMRAYQGDTCIMRCWETQQHLEHPRAWNATLESQTHWSNRGIRISSGVISHPEVFSSPRSQGFLFHCPVYRCMSVLSSPPYFCEKIQWL